MRELTDPETLRDRDDVAFEQQTRRFDGEEADAVREQFPEWDSHVAVGVLNDAGEVLLVDDGHHGWTLPAAPVGDGDDYVTAGREYVEALLDADVPVSGVERVRRIDYFVGDDDRLGGVYNVVVRADSVDSEAVAADPVSPDDALDAAGWFDEVPDGAAGPVAADAELFLG